MSLTISQRLERIAGRYPINPDLTFGLDLGIASIGSAVVVSGADPQILFAGSRCFEAPELPKTKELKNVGRRMNRQLRKTIDRRARRMAKLRSCLYRAGLLETLDPAATHNRKGKHRQQDPWTLRLEGLDRPLKPEELAIALLHIAKHRGFKSTKKSEMAENAGDENSKMLGAVEENAGLFEKCRTDGKYRTVGEMISAEPKFASRKRNRSNDYSHTLKRADLEHEIRTLFAAQQRLGNKLASDDLRDEAIEIAFHQRPLKDSDDLVGDCLFEDEKRAALHAPSFEKFRFLSKLTTLSIQAADGSKRRLTPAELSAAVSGFGTETKSITWNAVGKKIGLTKSEFFAGIDEKKAKQDICRTSGCAAGSKALYDTLGQSGWNAFRDKPEILDRIAALITFREDLNSIEKGLRGIDDLPPLLRDALIADLRDGRFARFKGAGHISATAARRLLPPLLDGLVYSDACAAIGYDHSQSLRIGVEDIRNPVVQRALREAVKQVETLVHHLGQRPGRIIVELGRDVGQSGEERKKKEAGMTRRHGEKEKLRKELREKLALALDPSEEELSRYELWREQQYRCLYSDESISLSDILTDKVQIDHALPRSRSQDNSYANRVLCLTKANQDKGNRTPFEWKGKDPAWWAAYCARVDALKIKRYKKNILRMTDFGERESSFVARNLNDTRYACRALLAALRDLYRDEGEPDPSSEGYYSAATTRRLFARPGAVTAMLRRSWGLASLKSRDDDRHHALDALICAAARGEWLLNALTRQYQELEAEARAKWTPRLPAPWSGFRDDAIAAFEAVHVCRSENRRARGALHKETIYAAGQEDGKPVTYERKAVDQLKAADLDRIKDGTGGNKPVADALRRWIEAGKPSDAPPLSAKGDPIRKVVLARSKSSGIAVRGGHADNGEMVRVDVFEGKTPKGKAQYFLVPIYTHQVLDKDAWPAPPNLAVVANKAESEWIPMGPEHRFRFSLYPDSYVEVTKSDGVIWSGYYRGTNRRTGALKVSPHNMRQEAFDAGGIGAKTLLTFKKFNVDRLGNFQEILQEDRLWHGAVCT